MLKSYGSLENNSRGRLYLEEDYRYRSIYGRDRDRIINSSAFRRLQYKTQVFVNTEGDHYRTRLTHSLEVAQIARWIASGLRVNKDLAEVVSLAHDLGHTPFGHAGENILNAKMAKFGGFCHNAHTLKLLTKLERRHLEFEGLNLSWEMLEGAVKHNGPLTDLDQIHSYILAYNQKHDLDLARYATLEAQIAAISDDIAYNNHDIEDGLRAELFTVEQLMELPFIGEKYKKILGQNPQIRREILVDEVKRRMTNDMVVDVVKNTEINLKKYNIKTVEDIRNAGRQLVSFSEKMEIAHQKLKKFLMENMYRHYKVNRMTANATKVVGGLFDFYMENPNCLPNHILSGRPQDYDEQQIAIIISDYIAGMTDRFAAKEYNSLLCCE